MVVDAIQANSQGTSELYSILSSIKLLLHSNANFEIKFSKRQTNMAVHTLAKATISWYNRTFFRLCLVQNRGGEGSDFNEGEGRGEEGR
jgi:hypothetical protein